MREYTLNDIKFNPEPLTLFEPDPEYKPNEEELEQDFRRNRELIKEMQIELQKILEKA
ncbi:MAG: hypothetical protein IJ679_01180 [Lachnospiraceae bacterium]|nr:hypothetical protein [Lachnospiraceae bacterium]